MKNSIKNASSKFGLLLLLLMFSIGGMAQTQYTMSIASATATANSIDVDLTVTATNPSPGARFAGFSAGVNFNTAIINGGTISATYVGGRSSEIVGLSPNAINVATPGSLRLSAQVLSGSQGVDMAQGTTLHLGIWRISNTANWASANANLWLQNVTASGKTNCLVNGYPYQTATPAFAYTTTAPASPPGLILSHTQAAPLSLTVGQVCATAAAQTGSTSVSCYASTNGSSTITLSPTPTVAGITYTVDGGSPISATLSSGAFTVSGLGAGSHTIVVSNAGCSNVTATGVSVGGPSQLTNSTTASACASYTWSVNGTAYTESGTYTASNTTGACPVAETLHLTITPESSNTTTASACGSYTWSVNDVTYTTSGTRTVTTGCHAEVLNLTITPNTTTTTTASSCDTYTWSVNDTAYTASGTYTVVTGCHTEELVLTIGTSVTYYADADGDGYGNAASTQSSCSGAPSGHVSDATDCDDTRSTVHPGGIEVANGIDDDCNGTVDDGAGAPPAPVVVTPLTLCNKVPAASLSASVTGFPGYTLKWYTVATGGTASFTAPTPSTLVIGTFHYYVSQVLSPNAESPRAHIVVTVVALPATPGVIAGPAAICSYIGSTATATYSIASVLNAASYQWTLPSGATLVSGDGTTSVVINFEGTSTGTTSLNIGVQSVSAAGCLSVAKTLVLTRVLPVMPASLVMTNGVTATAITAVGPFIGTTTALTLTAAVAATATNGYLWTLPTGVNQVSGGANDRIITVNFAGVGTGITALPISVQSMSGCGNSLLKTLSLTRALPATPGTITPSSTNVCLVAGTATAVTYTIPATVGAFSNGYAWTVPTGATIQSGQGSVSISVTYASNFTAGNISVTSSNGVGISALAKTLAVTRLAPVAPAALVMTNGVTTTAIVAVGPYIGTSTVLTLTATVAPTARYYNWSLPLGVNQLSGGNSNVITVNFADVASGLGSLPITVYSVNGCDIPSVAGKTLSLTRALPATPGTITPSTTNACLFAGSNTAVIYTIAAVPGAFANGYVWAVPEGAFIASGQGTVSIGVTYDSNFTVGNVSVTSSNGVGTSLVAKTLAITRPLPLAPAALVMTNGTTTTAITAVGPYIGTTTVLTLTATPAATATKYTWILAPGMHQLSGGTTNVITVDFAGVGTGITTLPITVYSMNGCELTSTLGKTLSLTRALPPTPGTITPSITNVCSVAGTSNAVTYTIAAVTGAFADGYHWNVPTGATIVSTVQNGTSIDVTFASSFTAGNVSVTASNGVGTSLVKTFTVARLAPAAPLALSGQLAGLCAGSEYSYTFAAGLNATTYLITGPTGSVITTAGNPGNTTNILSTSELAFTVVYPATAIANISFVASNGCSSSAAKLFVVTKAMSAPTAITGPTTGIDSCTEYTYTTPMVAGATTYTWTVPTGAVVVSGQTTNSLHVMFTNTALTGAVLKVKVSNSCGLSSLDKASAALSITHCSGGKSIVEESITAKAPFGAKAYPNPFAESFKLDLTTTSDQPVEVKVYDMMGKLVEVRQVNLSELSTQEVGDRYPTGVYNVIVSQGENVKTLRMIKR